MTHPQPAPGTPGAAEPSDRSSRPVHVVLAGGGTGGHIEPMLAVADALGRRTVGGVVPRITCLGTARGLETRLVPARVRGGARPSGPAP